MKLYDLWLMSKKNTCLVANFANVFVKMTDYWDNQDLNHRNISDEHNYKKKIISNNED